MMTNRRGALRIAIGGAAASAVTGAGSAAVKPSQLTVHQSGRDYSAALAKLRNYAAAELDAVGQAGMTLAIADGDGFAATLSVGWANTEARLPVRSNQLFEIGSISKSLTALCLHSLADEGKIDLDSPISRYVESASLPERPITLRQLLNHSGGLAHDSPLFPDNPDGRLWCGFEPGSRYSYSNVGFVLLGLAISQVTGRPHPDVIVERVLQPLGMKNSVARLMIADRGRFATGYVPFIEDRPILLRPAMVTGPFIEMDTAAGGVGASSEAMVAYLRYVIMLGRGKGGPLFSDARAKALLAHSTAADDFGPGARYSSGFATVSIDGRPAIHHTGGMILFTSAFHVDPAVGAACFASVNGRVGLYRPRQVTSYAIQLFRAVREGKALPDAPDPVAYRKVDQPGLWLGRWHGPDGRMIELLSDARMGLMLIANGQSGRIETGNKTSIVTDHADYSMHPFQLDSAEPTSKLMWWGPLLFGRNSTPTQPKPDPALLPYEGIYSGDGPWSRNTVIVRGNKLFNEDLGQIFRRPEGFWSAKEDAGGVTRLWFGKEINGRAAQLSVSGKSLARLS